MNGCFTVKRRVRLRPNVVSLPTITGISPPSITESPQLSGIGVSSLTSAD
jgi:hypothetical protein